MNTKCPVCGSTRNFGTGPGWRLRKYCQAACRQSAYRQRKIAQGYHFYRGYFYPLPVEAVEGVSQ